MSDYTDSLRNENNDEFTTFLLDTLSACEEKHENTIQEDERIYWQGRKDSMRIVLACHLNRPEIADLNRTTAFAHTHNVNAVKN